MGEQLVLTSAERAKLNDVKIRLRKAGVILDGLKWQLTKAYWQPVGFEFTCVEHKKVFHEADTTSHMAHDNSDLPAHYDPWRAAGIISAGYSELNTHHPVHIDFAIDRPGLCRVYISNKSARLQRSTKGAVPKSYKTTAAYMKVAAMLKDLTPSIDIDEHIGSIIDIGTPLEGISFQARDVKKLENCLKNAKDFSGGEAFAAGSKLDRSHVPLALSFLATEGLGFRQIWRPRPAISAGPTVMQPREEWQRDLFSANFGNSVTVQDMSSLHCAVSRSGCNIHVDGQGFVMVDAKGRVILDPDFLRHTLVELFWKTSLSGKAPLWLLNHVSFDIPSSPLAFSRAGVNIDLIQSKQYKLTLRGSCAIFGDFNSSGTLTFSGNF